MPIIVKRSDKAHYSLKKFWKVVLIVVIAVNNTNAQSFQKTALGIKSIINSNDVEIQFYSPTIIRVLKSPTGNGFAKESLSVIKKPQQVVFTTKQNGDLVNSEKREANG